MPIYDLIVVGGGTAGLCAALKASMEGVSTLLIEEKSYLGGTQTASLVTPMMQLLTPQSEFAGKINELIIGGLEQAGGGNGYWFDPEALKHIAEQLCIENKVTLLYESTVTKVEVEDNRIARVVVQHLSGESYFSGKYFIDATGDGDLSALAGVPFQIGKEGAKSCQPISLRFEMGNINLDKFSAFLSSLGQTSGLAVLQMEGAYTPDKNWPLTPIFQQALKNKVLKQEDCLYFQFFAVPGKAGVLSFNCPELLGAFDPLSPLDRTKAYCAGRASIIRLCQFMKENFAGFEDAYLANTASLLGVRDSRRIEGEYTLTYQDVAQLKKHSDAIVDCNYYMDIHGLPEEEFRNLACLSSKEPNLEERYFTIPFRCCIPKKIKNLLVAGRCISADFYAQSAIRIQLVCRGVGEACGTAVAMALSQNRALHDIDGASVRKEMEKQNLEVSK